MVNCAEISIVSDEDLSSSSLDSMEESVACQEDDTCSAIGGAENQSALSESRVEIYQNKKRPLSVPTDAIHKIKTKIPRLLANDIRKSYPSMIANVLNSGSFTMLYGFLDTFFDRNVQFSRVKNSPDGSRVNSLNLNNVNELAKFWYSIMRMSPDNVTKLTDPCIQYTTGNIIASLEMESTFLYETPMDAGYFASYILLDGRYGRQILYANDKRTNDYVVGRKYTNNISDGDVVSVEKLQDMKEIQASVDSIVEALPLRSDPQKVAASGKMIISTDENKRITKVEVIIVF